MHTGRVTSARFRVMGDAPTADAALAILEDHAFRETEIGAPDEVEAGFVTGQHLLDTQFTHEKNVYGDLLYFAIRIDTHKVPAELKQAYQRINEQAAADGNPSGFASKAQRRDARDLAGRQMHEDLAAGKFRRSRLVPLLWDLGQGQLHCAAPSNAVAEQVIRLMRTAFAVEVEPISTGTLAGRILRGQGRQRDFEDVHPTAFTDPPDLARGDDDPDMTIPVVPRRARSVDLKDFLGGEFAIWLWWLTEAREAIVPLETVDGDVFINIDRTLDMACAWGVGGRQALRGPAPTRMREARDALISGKWPRSLGLILACPEHQWELTLDVDRLTIRSARLPEVDDAGSPRELTEARLHLVRRLAWLLERMFETFVEERFSDRWPRRRDEIRTWIRRRA